MKYAAGITLYNPTKDQLARITELQKAFDIVLLFDNSEPNYEKPPYPQGDNIRVVTDGCNKGLSYAFNIIIGLCSSYDFLCTLDQDSTFLYDDIKRIQQYIDDNNDPQKIGIIAPYIDYGNPPQAVRCDVEQKKWVITSGAFLDLRVVRKEGLCYDENYFIDKFEIDLCWQFSTKGYKILMYHPSVLHQQLGEFGGRSRSSHNALRHYYLFRNRFYFNNKWFKGIKKWFLNFAQTIKQLYLILLFEDDKVNKLRHFKMAIKDYYKGKFGKKVL